MQWRFLIVFGWLMGKSQLCQLSPICCFLLRVRKGTDWWLLGTAPLIKFGYIFWGCSWRADADDSVDWPCQFHLYGVDKAAFAMLRKSSLLPFIVKNTLFSAMACGQYLAEKWQIIPANPRTRSKIIWTCCAEPNLSWPD